jgi:hypothetical protein
MSKAFSHYHTQIQSKKHLLCSLLTSRVGLIWLEASAVAQRELVSGLKRNRFHRTTFTVVIGVVVFFAPICFSWKDCIVLLLLE